MYVCLPILWESGLVSDTVGTPSELNHIDLVKHLIGHFELLYVVLFNWHLKMLRMSNNF